MVGVVGLVIYIYIINFANEGDDIQMSWIVFFFSNHEWSVFLLRNISFFPSLEMALITIPSMHSRAGRKLRRKRRRARRGRCRSRRMSWEP